MQQATPIIIAGDYNDVWGTLNRRCMQPADFTPVSKKARTFPAIMPIRQLDNMYYRGQIKLLHSFPGTIQLARQASDHLPLVADFEIST